MQARRSTFGELINGNKQFIIPVFQRDYAWGEVEWRQLWDDIARSATAGRTGHFVGPIVHIPDTTTATCPSYLVIDGQQRLTTLTILCAALRDHIKENAVQSKDDLPSADQIEVRYITNPGDTGDLKYKMVLRRSDDETLRAVVDGKPLDALTGDKSTRIIDAYAYFRRMLSAEETDIGAIYRGATQLRIVEISLDRAEDDPQGVFESMNSTGVDLTPGDLVRNYLLIGVEEAEQTRLYREYWHHIEQLFRRDDGAIDDGALNFFLRDYIALKQGTAQQIRNDRIYQEFKAYAYDKKDNLAALESFLGDIRRFAGYYSTWNGRVSVPSPGITKAMQNVRRLGNTTGLIAMRLYDLFEREALSEHNFVQALNFIEGYLLRHAVCGHRIQSYWRIFAGMSIDIENDAPATSLKITLIRERGYYGSWTFPSNEDFAAALENSNIYHFQSIRKFLLDRLENAGQREPSPVSEYSIEHIMPQSLTDKWREMLKMDGADPDQVHEIWLHRLGNLTLTAYNPELANSPFETKRTREGGFNESAVRLNQYVRQQTQWTATQMEGRGKMLAERALEIWPYPQVD